MIKRMSGLALIGAIALVLPTSQPALAAHSGECVTVRVDAPFRLPNGLLYPAGALTLCDMSTFSPVSELHKILVNGSSIGLFLGRNRRAEIQSIGFPEVVFERDGKGNLELVGYSVQSAGTKIAYQLQNRREIWQASTRRRLGGAPVAAVLATATIP
jgi:hypothetical protein